MQAPPREPIDDQRDVIIIPEASTPRNPGPIAAVVAVVVAALVLGVVGGYLWGHHSVGSLETAAETTHRETQVREAAAASAAQAQVAAVNERIADLIQNYRRSQQHVSLLLSAQREAHHRIVDLEVLLKDAQGKLTKAQHRSSHPGGPPLSDGAHIGKILAISASSTPPRLVLDPGQLYTGHAAHVAAVQDGVIPPDGSLPHHRYFRNVDGGWTTTPVVPGARVTLWHWRGHRGARVVGIGRLEQVLSSGARWAVRVRHHPFWVTVVEGQISSIREQPYP